MASESAGVRILLLAVKDYQEATPARSGHAAARLLQVARAFEIAAPAFGGPGRPRWWTKLSGKRAAVAIELDLRGMSIRDAAREMRVGPEALSRWFRDAGGKKETARTVPAVDAWLKTKGK